MKSILKRLAALNLVLLLIFTMLPVTTFAAQEDPEESSVSPESGAELLASSYQSISVPNKDGSTSYYTAGSITLGSTTVSVSGGQGTGWSYQNGRLTLTEDYCGDPISTTESLLIRVEGDVTVRGNGGPALTASGGIRFLSSSDDSASLTLIGDGAAAINSGYYYSVEVESPLNLVLEGDETPVSPRKIQYTGKQYAPHKLLRNTTFTGEDASSAEEVASINVYANGSTSNSTLQPYLPYVRFEAVWKEDLEITLMLDPNGGTLPGESTDGTEVYTVSDEEYSFHDYYDVEIDLANVPVPTRDGHLFAGWMMENDEVRWYAPDEIITTQTADTALTAQWLATGDAYILFNGNGQNLLFKTAKEAGMAVCGVYDDSSKEYMQEIKNATDYYIYDFSELLKIF